MDSVLDRRRLQAALEEDMFVGTRRTSTRTGATLLALFSLYFFVSSTTVDTTTVQPTRTSGSQRCPSFAPGNAATSTKRQPFVCNYTFFLHMPFLCFCVRCSSSRSICNERQSFVPPFVRQAPKGIPFSVWMTPNGCRYDG